MFKNVFGSGFLVRTAHVVLTWVVTLILFLHDTGGFGFGSGRCLWFESSVRFCSDPTELRKQEETGQLVQPVLFVLLVLVSVLLYFTVSLMDPGFILPEDRDLQVSLTESGPGPGLLTQTQNRYDRFQNHLFLRTGTAEVKGHRFQHT